MISDTGNVLVSIAYWCICALNIVSVSFSALCFSLCELCQLTNCVACEDILVRLMLLPELSVL